MSSAAKPCSSGWRVHHQLYRRPPPSDRMGVRLGPHSAWYGNSLNRAPERSRPNARAAPFTKDSPRCGNLSIDSRAPQVLASIAKNIGYSSYPLLHPQIGVLDDPTRGIHDVPWRQTATQLAAFGLGFTALLQAELQGFELDHRERALDTICSAARYVVQPAQVTVNASLFLIQPDIIFVLQIAFSCSSSPTVAFHRGSSPASPGQVDFIASSLALRSTSA